MKVLFVVFAAALLAGVIMAPFWIVIRSMDGVTQGVEDCYNEDGLEIWTHGRVDGIIVYTRSTWLSSGLKCVPWDSALIVKKRERELAEEFLKKHKEVIE
jgi:hypothetical protein